ncbi:MAG: Hsp20/alpha crystallin family protein [Alphaproteobacteria bacterium]|nr:MAG: Hsp20/alpha crystallin family protein [Alphaproteobacteria bacterium]
MAMRDLIPWNKNRDIDVRRDNDIHPFLALHREMNRMFDDVFRSFDVASFGLGRGFASMQWPSVGVDETDKEIRVTAELPGLDEKDVDVQITDGVLSISGEKKLESEDRDRRLNERYYGRFERRLAVGDVEQDKATASFKNGVLSITLPKSERARQNVRRIAINGKS